MLRIYIVSIAVAISSLSMAQTTYKGIVTDGTTQTPVPGANVVIRSTFNGDITKLDGSYSLQANPGDTLEVSFISYTSKQVVLGSNATVNIVIEPNVELLNEAVIIGYGSQKKKDITGAVSVVDSEEFENRPNTQISSLIQGKAAGVNVLSSSGKPNAGLSIRIRGTNSISAGSEPLYVIDGVPTTDTRSLNPADIESISILKDASSAAIYGAQGANGVVLITTKKGTSLQPQFNFSTYVGFSEVWNTIKVLNRDQYRDLMQELGYNTDWSQYQNNTDWQDEIFNRGISQNYQLSVSGKNNKTSYYLSGGWVQQKGTVRSAEMERYSFKINLEQELKSWLKVGTNMLYTDYRDVDVTDNTNVNSGGVLLGVLTTPPNIGITDSLGQFTSNPFQNWENPYAATDGRIKNFRNQRFLSNAYLEATFLQDFKFRSNFGIDYGNSTNANFLDPFLTSFGRALKGSSSYDTNLLNYYIFDNTVSYTKAKGKHTINVLGGFVLQQFKYENSSIETRNFASSEIITPNGGSELFRATGSQAEKANTSVISRINYEYDGRYLFTANFRADGSSAFGPNQKWGYFPSFSAGWRISQEAFMRDVTAISDLKLRAGYGIVGNDQIGNYAYLGRIGSGANYPIGGVAQPGTFPASIENRDLKWEESEQINLGIDFGFFAGRVGVSIDGYVKNTSDLLLNAPLPLSTGFSSGVQNIGELQNKGLEFLVNTVNYDRNEFVWTTSFNLTINRNEVIDILGDEITSGGIPERGDVSLVREGEALGVFYGYVSGGVDPETGNIFYIDRNGESTFDPVAEDRRIIGNPNPDFYYGLTNSVTWRSFGLSIFIQGSQGNDIFNATRIETEGMNSPKNQSAAVLDRWRNPGDVTDIPRSDFGGIENSLISTRFVEDGSYLRFKAVTLTYDFPTALMKKAKLQSLRLYVTGENLLTFTDYSGYDPEVNAFGGSNLAQGVDYGTYPQTRNIIFGLNLTF